ncbi:MAG: hypothetical protein AAGB16_05810 [Pseudomonadota bacterium]
MTEIRITIERVLELIEAYGAEPGGWPKEERVSAKALLAAQPDQFATALAEARKLDALLLEEQMPDPSTGLADALLAAAPQPVEQQQNLFGSLGSILFPQGVRWPAGAALASLMMGLVGGYAYASTGAGYDQAESAYYSAFGFDESSTWLATEQE